MRLFHVGGADVLPAMHHADDIDAAGMRNIEYDIILNRKTAQVVA